MKAFFGFLLLTSYSALAYIPPSQYLVDEIAKKHGGVKTAAIQYQVKPFDGENERGDSFTEMVFVNFDTGMIESQAQDEDGKAIFYSKKFFGTPKNEVVPGKPASVLSQILFNPYQETLGKTLEKTGFPIRLTQDLLAMRDEIERRASEQTHLKKVESKIYWVIGALEKDPRAPQIWIEKGVFLPEKLIYSSSEINPLEVELTGYSMTKSFSYPRKIEVLGEGKKIFQMEVVKINTNVTLPDSDAAKPNGFLPVADSISPELKDRIALYYSFAR